MRNIVLKKIRDVGLEGAARIIEEIRPRRRKRHQSQQSDGTGKVEEPRCFVCHSNLPDAAGVVPLKRCRNESVREPDFGSDDLSASRAVGALPEKSGVPWAV